MTKWVHFSSFHIYFLFMVLISPKKKMHVLQFCADLSKNSKPVKATKITACEWLHYALSAIWYCLLCYDLLF